MKVLQFLTHLDIGGITTYVYTLSKYLKKEGVEVAVVSSGGSREDDFRKAGIPVFCVNIRTKSEISFKVLTSVWRLAAIRKRFPFDIIHAHTRVTHVAAHIFSFLRGIPYIANFHGFYHQHRRRWGRKVLRAQGNIAVAITPSVGEDLIKFFRTHPERVRVILSAIDLEEMEKEEGAFHLEGYPRIGTSGRLSPVKGFDCLIRSMKRILKRFPEAHLYILGEGKEERRLLSLAESEGLKDNVTILKRVSLPSFLRSLDIFCLPSREEPLGLSVLEAQYFGIPCVVSDTGGLRIIVDDKKTGLRVPVDDDAAIAEAIITLMEDEDLRERISKNSRIQIREKFNFATRVDEFIKVYNEVLKSQTLI